GSVRLRPGDRVMQTRNDYQKMVFNGDVGRVRAVRPAERLVEVEFPESDEPVVYEEDELEQLTPAYAISVHKSQGSEHAAVVMPITSVMPALMTRNLLYTALTRAKRLAVLVGSRSALRQYVRNQQAGRRHSMLAARLGAGR